MADPLISQDLLAKLTSFFARPQGTAQDLKDQPDFFRGSEFVDEASKRAYAMDTSAGTPGGRAFTGYEFAPGMFKDNVELNNRPYEVFDSMGKYMKSGTFTGMSAKWDTLNVLAPLAMMLPAFGATIMGAGAAVAAPGAAAGAAEPVAAAAAGGEVAAGTGTGLSATAGGTGYSLAAPAAAQGGVGLTATAGGAGYGLAAPAIAPGVITAAAPGAAAIGAGIGATELLAGTGTLLGPTALSGSGGAGVSGAAPGSGLTSKLGEVLTSKLGQIALTSLASNVIGSAIAGGGVAPPPVEKATSMPDPDPTSTAQQRIRRNSFVQQLARRGRASTIMTSPRSGGKLGG